MTQAMIHRGPDDQGLFTGRAGSLSATLGHRRLSIIDLEDGHQPIDNEDKSKVIVFNGEIYNFRQLRAELENKGHRFTTHSDTEVILHLYEDYGEKCLEYLRGAFAFAIWDNRSGRLFCARDRIGKKPFLYAFKEGNFVFASEFKAILESGLVSRDINPEALDAYLSYGYVPAPLTIYKDIFKLLPAHYLVLDEGGLETHRYWSLDFSNKLELSQEVTASRLKEMLDEAVRIRMISDVPLGAFLSGGVDSTIVVGLMSRISDRKIKTFSIGFSDDRYNELGYARIAAKAFNTEHREFIVKPQIEGILPLLAEGYGEPYADSSSIPSYYLARMTRDYVKVALNGDGGDELFAGYERHWANRLAVSWPVRLILAMGGRALVSAMVPGGTHPKGLLSKARRFAAAANNLPAARYQSWVGVFTQDFKNRLYSREFKDSCVFFRPLGYLDELFDQARGLDPVDSFLYVDNLFNLPNDFLVKMDTACMLNSLEGRSPFLDYQLMEFASRIPSGMKVRGRTGKYILRKAFRELLPDKIRKRGKMGFALPIGFWFRNELKDFIKATLLSERALERGYFNPEALKNMLGEHFKASQDYTRQIWALLMLELWHQRFID